MEAAVQIAATGGATTIFTCKTERARNKALRMCKPAIGGGAEKAAS